MAESKAEPERRADRQATSTDEHNDRETTRMRYDGVCGWDCVKVVHEDDHSEEQAQGRVAEPMS